MDDIVDYSKKLNEQTNKFKKITIIISAIILVFSFSIGYYVAYRINTDESKEKTQVKFNTIYDILKNEWYYGKDDDNIENTLLDRAIYGMVDTNKDPFTRYLTSLGSLADTYEGLGISIMEYKEYFVITEVTSLDNIEAGLKVGDIIKEIDGVSLANKSSSDLKDLLNSEYVNLLIERNNNEYTIRCHVTTYSPVTVFKNFDYSPDFAYIKIDEFGVDTGSEFENYLQEAKSFNYKKLILDLRDNPGGYISSVVDCADLLMDKGKVVLTTKDKDGNSYSYKTTTNKKYDFNQIIVLINENSASGAEALSAALNENMNDKVILYGERTYGKGSAQKTIYFTDGTYFHYTYALWYTPLDHTINKQGVDAEVTYVKKGVYTYSFSKTELEEGNYGEDVKNLQNILKELNYYTGDVTGIFDSLLKDSLISYQHNNGIEETGKLDTLTIRYILKDNYISQIKDYNDEVLRVIEEYK